MVHIHTFLQKVRRALKSERGEANYFSTVVFIFIAVILLAFIIDLFSIISTKQELDHAADQMVKQIQLSGGINSETDSLFDFLCSEIEGSGEYHILHRCHIQDAYAVRGCPGPSSWGPLSTSPLRARPSWRLLEPGSGQHHGGGTRLRRQQSTTGSEVAYEAFSFTAAPAALQRAGRDHFLCLLFCSRGRHAHLFPAPVRLLVGTPLPQHPATAPKMELNNLSATIYADTYRSQRETNFEEYLRTLYSSNDYTEMLEATVAGGLAEKIPLSTEDYEVSDISLEFNVVGDRVEYVFYCDVDFYIRMFGHSYPAITQRVELTGYHNTKF